MEKKELLYDGKAKTIFATEDSDYVMMCYKDDAVAYFGVKKSSIKNKGKLNSQISEILFRHLEKAGIPTHFVRRADDSCLLCRRAKPIPLEFIVRNVIAGSLSRRLDIQEGTLPLNTIYEICLKNDALRDPMINRYHVMALGYATAETLDEIQVLLEKVNKKLTSLFKILDVDVIDFKLEFGFDKNGQIMLIDEISPDTARLWDSNTKECLDSDCFRRNLGEVESAYQKVLERLSSL